MSRHERGPAARTIAGCYGSCGVAMGKKRKLRKQMRKRSLDDVPCVVICGGSSCAPRKLTRELVSKTREYAASRCAPVRVEVVRCLHICKKGPIVATYPEIRFHKRVDVAEARELVDSLSEPRRRDRDRDREK